MEHRHRYRGAQASARTAGIDIVGGQRVSLPTPLPPLDCLIGSHYVGTIIIIQGFFTAVPQSARALARGPVTRGGHAPIDARPRVYLPTSSKAFQLLFHLDRLACDTINRRVFEGRGSELLIRRDESLNTWNIDFP